MTRATAPKTMLPENRIPAAPDHTVGTTPYLEAQMAMAPRGPVALQYAYDPAEEIDFTDAQADPIGDVRNGRGRSIVHRYPDRALLLVSDRCAAYCRFCMRKHRVGKGYAAIPDTDLDEAVAYIQAHPEIWEVILSGGDPLILSPRRLDDILSRLESIPHVAALRIHTRLPSQDPGRITDDLIATLTNATAKPITMVVHINHADELTAPVRASLTRLRKAGISLLSQSVLLAGVNDDADTLESLFRALVTAGVKPYYLHHPDLVPGTAHFQVPLEHGQALMTSLRGRLSGIAIPSYVLDIPGGYGKVAVTADNITPRPDGRYNVIDPQGQTHLYPPPKKPVAV